MGRGIVGPWTVHGKTSCKELYAKAIEDKFERIWKLFLVDLCVRRRVLDGKRPRRVVERVSGGS